MIVILQSLNLPVIPAVAFSPGLDEIEEISGNFPPADRHSRPLRAQVLLGAALTHTCTSEHFLC